MLDKLKKLFPQFELSESKIGGETSYHGVIYVNRDTERMAKARVKFGNIFLYISSEMYENTDKSFFYGMIGQKTKITEFRKHNAKEIESNKVFQSDKDVSVLIDKLYTNTDMSLYRF